MLTSYIVRGYKSLLDVNLSPARLNVLVGGNACGKSSLLQTMLLLRQSAYTDGTVSSLQLSGGLFEAGTARDVLHPEAGGGIELTIASDERTSHTATFVAAEPEARQLASQSPLTISGPLLDLSGENFAYLNAERIAPKLLYQLPIPGATLSGSVGMHGEFTAAFLARCQESNRAPPADWYELLSKTAQFMPEDLMIDEDSKRNLTRLDRVAEAIVGWIIPGIDFQTSEHAAIDTAQLLYVRDPSGTRTLVRPTHMGFGVTYTLPVIASALGIANSGLLLIENPEAHLHPSSQSRIGVFLAIAASVGAQTFIETHSDHVINGIRLAVKGGLIAHSDVKFYFFTRPVNGDSTTVTELLVTPEGRVSAWPEGFFDQIERDLSRL